MIILLYYFFFTQISYIIIQKLILENNTLVNTIVNAVIVGCFSLGGIIYTQQKTQERYESELTQKDFQMKVQQEYFNDMIIYMSNYPHEVHALIKLKDILEELISVYDNPQVKLIPTVAYDNMKPTYFKSQDFINSPLYYYLNKDMTSKIKPIFDTLNEKYNISYGDTIKIQMNRYAALFSDTQLESIRKMIPEIENMINEIIKNEINYN